MVQQVKVGAIDMMVTGSSIWATVLPEIGMLDLGYMFDSYAQVAKAMEGPVGATFNDMLQKRAGCTILTWASHFGPRNVYTKQPVKIARRDQGREAARAAHARVHRDLQDHGRDPHAASRSASCTCRRRPAWSRASSTTPAPCWPASSTK